VVEVAARTPFNREMMKTYCHRLRRGWSPIVEASVGATLAWVVATMVIGHLHPFFAPAATILVLTQARGARISRAGEVFLAVAGGVLLADIVAQLLSPWPTLTVLVLIVLTLTITTLLDASAVIVVQATVSALYVAVISPPSQTLVPARFIDALVGGGIALVISQIGASRDPFEPVVAQVRLTCHRIGNVISAAADAIERHDPISAADALADARTTDASAQMLEDAAVGTRESLLLDPFRRRRRADVQAVLSASRQLDYAVRGTRVLARASLMLTRWPTEVTTELPLALRHLQLAVAHLGEALVAELRRDEAAFGSARADLEAETMTAIALSRSILTSHQPLPVVVIVGQLRSITIDLLRGAGDDDAGVINRIDEELGFPTVY